MNIEFPSRTFDEVVAAICHGTASDEQLRGLNLLLRTDTAARDEYILRLELHSRLASESDLFASADSETAIPGGPGGASFSLHNPDAARWSTRKSATTWAVALAASLALIVAGVWTVRSLRPADNRPSTSRAVAMLNRTVDAQWSPDAGIPRLNAPLEPGPLRLEAGLAQIIFYSGARMVIEGPAELQLVSQNEAFWCRGRAVVEIPAQARGFRIRTPHLTVTDLGSAVGLHTDEGQTGLHALQGDVRFTIAGGSEKRIVPEGDASVVAPGHAPVSVAASQSLFASLFDFQARSQAAETRRYHQWRNACKHLEADESLVVHFLFENTAPSGWQIRNLGNPRANVSDATLVGCQWTEGRWPRKQALGFQSVNDRLRVTVPGKFQSLTLSAWVSVKGLDRKINSLFMSDGFEPQTVHWLIRRDGVLGLTVIGSERRNHQIAASPPVVTLDKFGMWLHLAVVLDGAAGRVTHYINAVPVSEDVLKIAPPFRVGTAELGNWNAKGFPESDPFMIRNFSGAMDEFCLFNRALNEGEIRALYAQGKPQGDTLASH